MKKEVLLRSLLLSISLIASVQSARLMAAPSSDIPQHQASSIEGHWEGQMIREGAQLPVTFDFGRGVKGFEGSFDSPTQRALGIPLRNVSFTASKVHFELVGDSTTTIFDGELSDDTMTGRFREDTAQGTYLLKRAEKKPLPYRSEEVSFQNGHVLLSGTLLLPLAKGQHPAVVFLHGSGPEGRFATRFLAVQFACQHIAALIYDQRGVGKSTGDWKQSNFDDLAGDAIAAIHLLQQRADINPKAIGILGHSQGGSISPLIASRSKDVAFVIAAAAFGTVQYEQDLYRVRNGIRNAGFSEEETAKAMAFYSLWVNVGRTGEGWDQLEAAIPKVRGEKWFGWVEPPPKDNWVWKWYRPVANYNPLPYWESVHVPVLLIYGERDQNTPAAISIKNIDWALRRAGNKDYTIIELPRAAHDLTISAEPGQPFEWRHDAPGYVALLIAWTSQRVKSSSCFSGM